jgi:peptide methionine sulfoxide reductase msrA/msrB
MFRYHPLSPQEDGIICHGHTEPAYSGIYNHFDKEGVFICKRCTAPLYLSQHKFSSHCGWPSFEEELPGAVKRLPDPDGVRIEIQCNHCQAHLGHVFSGEGFTSTNTRHCVNSLSLSFISAFTEEGYERAFFAGGCFWGVQYFMEQLPGVIQTTVGYMGGHVANPTYEEVCSSATGHIEALEILFDPSQTSYETLAKEFFEIHDPTQATGQGPDIGPQYISAIFYLTEAQKETIAHLITVLKKKKFQVVTKVLPATQFYPAETYHQYYYEHSQKMPYCHKKVSRF